MTSKESFEALKRLREEPRPYEVSNDELAKLPEGQQNAIRKANKEWADDYLMRLNQAIKNLKPVKGTKCTIMTSKDNYPATVTKRISADKIEVSFNKLSLVGIVAEKYKVYKILNEFKYKTPMIFVKTVDGYWIPESAKNYNIRLNLEYQTYYFSEDY